MPIKKAVFAFEAVRTHITKRDKKLSPACVGELLVLLRAWYTYAVSPPHGSHRCTVPVTGVLDMEILKYTGGGELMFMRITEVTIICFL